MVQFSSHDLKTGIPLGALFSFLPFENQTKYPGS
jgi:hypothetical protein